MEDPNKKVKLQIDYPEEFQQNLQRKASYVNNLLKQYNDGVINKDVLIKILHFLTATEVYLICNVGYADAEFIKRKRIVPLLIELDFGPEQLRALENALLKPGKGLECTFVERLDTINYPRVYFLWELLDNDWRLRQRTIRCVYKKGEDRPIEFVQLYFYQIDFVYFVRLNSLLRKAPALVQGNAFVKICIEEVPPHLLGLESSVNIFSEDGEVDFLVLFRIFYRLLSIPGIYIVKRYDSQSREVYLNEKV